MSIFKAFAEDEHNAVPVVRKNNVNVESDGVAVVAGAKSPGTGYKEYAAVAVRTTRKLSRGFARERYVVNNRRRDLLGSFDESVASFEDASRGIGKSVAASSTA
jgi:5-deoxy-D-glucuronate isomerase